MAFSSTKNNHTWFLGSGLASDTSMVYPSRYLPATKLEISCIDSIVYNKPLQLMEL